MGDVVFSNAAIDSLFKITLPSWILGRGGENRITGKEAGELFAFTFNPNREDVFSNIKSKDWNSGKLWEYFHKFHKVPLESIVVITGPCHAEEVA